MFIGIFKSHVSIKFINISEKVYIFALRSLFLWFMEYFSFLWYTEASLVAQTVKNLRIMQEETQVWSLDQEDPVVEENGNPLQYSCLKKIPWKTSLMGYNPKGHKGSQRVRHDWMTKHKHIVYRKKTLEIFVFFKKDKILILYSIFLNCTTVNKYLLKTYQVSLEFYQLKNGKSNCSYGTCILVSSIYSRVTCIWHSSITLTLKVYITKSDSCTLLVY